jgi:mannose-6-phosphate isomerase-like protein (cupin superfamily)
MTSTDVRPAQPSAPATPAGVPPTFFSMRVPLPAQGRQDTVVATSERMRIVVKTYAAGGENGLHTHPNEDHAFFILQGRAEFYGPGDETRTIGVNEGVLLPRGSFYWFKCTSPEPLVMIRVGCPDIGADPTLRLDIDGRPVAGNSAENKDVPLILGDSWFG